MFGNIYLKRIEMVYISGKINKRGGSGYAKAGVCTSSSRVMS